MPTLENYERGGWLSILMKGDPGSGKTRAYADFPKPIRILDFDGKPDSILEVLPDNLRKDVHYTFYNRNQIKDFDKDLDDLIIRNDYPTLVMPDSLTTCAIATIHYFNDSSGEASTKGEKEGKGKIIGGIRIPGLEEFGGEATVLQNLADTIRSLRGCHRIVTAHVVDQEKSNWSRRIMTAGKKIGIAFPAYFKEIWHFEFRSPANVSKVEGTKYFVRTISGGSDFARTSIGLDPEIEWTGKGGVFEIIKNQAEKKGIKVFTSKTDEREHEQRKHDSQTKK